MDDRRFSFVVAEDEERIREYIARKTMELDPSFVCVATAADGEEAAELVERHLPDLLITDIKMPELTGVELIERVRRTNPDIRILIVSGYSEFEYARRAIELDVDEYILKPVNADELRRFLLRIRIQLEASAGTVDAQFGLDRIGLQETELAKAVELYLREHFRQPYSLEHLASRFGCKTAYLIRLYRKVIGSTPTQDLIRFRIEKAKRLLTGHPHLEIKQVAAAVGYEDALYFSRLFKKEAGLNPTAFRDSMSRS
jgi:two-component system response regulator YesN